MQHRCAFFIHKPLFIIQAGVSAINKLSDQTQNITDVYILVRRIPCKFLPHCERNPDEMLLRLKHVQLIGPVPYIFQVDAPVSCFYGFYIKLFQRRDKWRKLCIAVVSCIKIRIPFIQYTAQLI